MRIFGKNCKIASASGTPPPNHRLSPAAGELRPRPQRFFSAYYYNVIEFDFSVKIRFSSLKNGPNNYRICSTFASSAVLHLFFTSNSVDFVDGGRKNVSYPRAQGILATPLFIYSSTDD